MNEIEQLRNIIVQRLESNYPGVQMSLDVEMIYWASNVLLLFMYIQ